MQHSSWHQLLKEQLPEGYLSKSINFRSGLRSGTIYPPREKVFEALKKTNLEEVKVVILGQDPYHGPGQAQGLSFSVPDDIPAPPIPAKYFKRIGRRCRGQSFS